MAKRLVKRLVQLDRNVQVDLNISSLDLSSLSHSSDLSLRSLCSAAAVTSLLLLLLLPVLLLLRLPRCRLASLLPSLSRCGLSFSRPVRLS
jgi:hypothetical protein